MLKNVPLKVTKEEVQLFLSEFQIESKDIQFIRDFTFQFKGDVVVFLHEAEDVERCIKTKNKSFIKNKAVEVFACT